MIPRVDEKGMKGEPDYLPTRLLAATVAFYVDKTFCKGSTMVEIQCHFVVRPKPSVCALLDENTRAVQTEEHN